MSPQPTAPASLPRARPMRAARRRRHLGRALGIAAALALSGAPLLLPVLRDRLQAYLEIGDERFGLIFSLGPLVGVAGILASGALLNRVGAVALFRGSLLGTATGLLLIAAGGGNWLLVLAGCVTCALFAGPLNIAGNASLTRLFPHDPRRILALGLAVVSAAGILIPLGAEGLLWLVDHLAVPFGTAFRLPLSVVALLLVAASSAYRTRRQGRGPSGAPWTWRILLVPLPLAWLAVLLALHGAADTVLYTWMSRFLTRAANSSPTVAPGLVLAGTSLAYLVSRSLLALLPDRTGRRAFLVLPGLLGGSLLALGVLARDPVWAAWAYVAAAFLWSAEFPAFLGAIARHGKVHFGAANALFQVLVGPLTFLTMNGTGLMIGRFGEEMMWLPMLALAGMFVLAGLGGALWLALFSREAEAIAHAASPIALAEVRSVAP